MSNYLTTTWTEYSGGVLYTAAWQALLIAGAGEIAMVVCRRAAARSLIWSGCIVAVAAAPLLALTLPHCVLGHAGPSEPVHFPTLSAHGRTGPLGRERAPDMKSAIPLAIGCWGLGGAAAALRLAWSAYRMRALTRRAVPCRDPRVCKILERITGDRHTASAREVPGLVSAMCWQLHRPVIFLPDDTRRLNEPELEMILRHEWAHVQHGHAVILFVQRLVEVLFWFHPVCWWISLQAARHREYLCDDQVLLSGHSAADYAHCLARMARRCYGQQAYAGTGLNLVRSPHLVLLRVRRLLSGAHAGHFVPQRPRALIVGGIILLILLLGVARIPCGTGWTLSARWTAWPPWSAELLDVFGIRVRDYPLDVHRYEPQRLTE